MGLDACEIGEHIGPIRVFRRQLVEEGPDGRTGDRLLQGAEPRLRCLFEILHLPQGSLQRILQPHAALGQRLAFAFLQRIELLLGERLAVLGRHNHHACRRAGQHEALLAHDGVQLTETLVALAVQLAAQRIAALSVLVAGEHLVQRVGHLSEQGVHLFAQLDAAARRQTHRARAVGIAEIVDVAPIGRHATRQRPWPQEIASECWISPRPRGRSQRRCNPDRASPCRTRWRGWRVPGR